MPRRSRSNSPSPKKTKKANKSHKRTSASPSPSSSSSSSRSRSPPRNKPRRSASNGDKPKVKSEPHKARVDGIKKNDKKPRESRSRSPVRPERAKSKEGTEKSRGKDRRDERRDQGSGNRGKEKGREGNNNRAESGVKRESKIERKVKASDSPPALGGRRWDDDSVKKHEGGWGTDKDKDKSSAIPVEKLKPDFAPSGALEEERHTVNGINLNYSEPPDARQPDAKWRLYVFKGEKQLEPLAIHRQSAYIVGRERKVAHLPIDHPSCSKQHSVIQFRIKRVTPATADEEAVTAIRPYIIDLNSTNGTILNGTKIDPAKYYELLEEDVLRFGHSTREYVLLKAEAQAGPATLD